jgi:uncharacterized cupin superfamily protein
VANIFQPEWVERAQAPLIGRTARVGAQAGAERLGATLYEIDPGNNGSPFHLHHSNEEMIIVVAGRPTLRTLDGLRQLEPGDVIACPVGPRGAHQLQNTTDEPVRALVVSTMVYPEVAEQLDSDKVLVHSARRVRQTGSPSPSRARHRSIASPASCGRRSGASLNFRPRGRASPIGFANSVTRICRE